MPRGMYIRTEEVKNKNRLASLGKPAWNKGIKVPQLCGEHNGFFGKTHNEETKMKMRLAKLGKVTWLTGKKRAPFSEDWRRNMGRSGNKHHNWKGGKTPLGMRIRTSFEYRQWRSDVFKRDGYTCQRCGRHGGNMEAHHIKLFSIILDEYNITTVEEAINNVELWDINNGTTLCVDCHNQTKRTSDGQ